MMRRASGLLLSLALLPGFAAAQTTAEVEATWRLLVGQAQAAQATGDHPRALDLGLRAVSIHASPSLYRFVAQEQSHLGLTVPALTSAQRCVDAVTADRNAPERATTLSTCAALVRDLQARVGHLVIEVPTPVPAGLTVTVAGAVLPPALFGVPYLVTPGHVGIDATAPGRIPLHRSVDVTATAAVPVRIELAAATAAATTLPVRPIAPAPVPVRPAPVPVRPGSVHRSLAWANRCRK